jgi:glycosyltransferase involved in cell wall biosynthesis
LRQTIAHLAAQDMDPSEFEVIVVDDGSSDRTPDVVAECRAHAPFVLTYLRHDNRGPGYTQNRGIRAARGRIVLLIADDIFLVPTALRTHLDLHQREPDVTVAALGRVVQSPQLDQTVFLRTWDPFRFRELSGLEELPYYLFWACNISCKRDFLIRHGMFREERGRAGAAAHEDVELGYRLHKHGLRIRFAVEALGYHYHIETLEGAMRRAYERGLNFGEFRDRVPDSVIVVRYHVLDWQTLGDHVRALRRPNRDRLLGADGNPLLLAIRYAVRGAMFNRVTVPLVWLPLMRHAETSPFVARFMHRQLYRGVISFRMRRGYAEGKRIYS